MNFGIVISLVLALVALNVVKSLKVPMLAWIVIWWVAVFSFLSFGFSAPLPKSIISEYMLIATLALLAYVASDKGRLKSVKDPLLMFMTERKFNKPLVAVMVALPLLVALKVYLNSKVEILPPGFSRSAHPAPPDSIDFKGKKIDLIKAENPFRKYQTEDTAKFQEHVAKGKIIYYQNCFFCHGDAMEGDGLYAHGLNPLPTNFQDPATIGRLQESFLFWRVAKGGIGRPGEGGPWDSAMPAWEDFLEEDELWNVILFLYEYTGNKPRALEHHE